MIQRAAIYTRVSDQSQVEGDSLDAQRDTLLSYAKKHGYMVVAEYEEAGQSARVSNRPAFQTMAADAKQGRFDTVLLWKWDRFARNREDAVIYKMLFEQYGVALVAVGEPQLDGSEGRLLEGIMDLVAEFQSATTAAHVKNTMLHNVRQGRWQGLPPFGYRIDEVTGKLRIEEPEAQAMRWAFQVIAQRKMSMSELARIFRAGRMFPATLRYKWSVSSVRNLLSNPAFIGVVRWNRKENVIVRGVEGGTISSKNVARRRSPDEWVIVHDAHPAVIDKDVFNVVQRLLRSYSIARSHRNKAGEYLFRGLCRCAQCGGNMVYEKKGNNPVRLTCSRYTNATKPCRPGNWIHMTEIVATVIEKAEQVTKATTIEGIEVTASEFNQPKVEEPDWDTRYKRLIQLHVNGLIDIEEYKRQRQMIDEDKASWAERAGIQKDELLESLPKLQEQVSNIATLLRDDNVSVENKNLALQAVIDHIVVDRSNREIEIVWLAPNPLL